MTADEAARTGERRRKKSDSIRHRDAVDPPEGVTVGRALTAMTFVPALGWPEDLFADAYVDTALPVSGSAACGPVIWRQVLAHGSALAGVAP